MTKKTSGKILALLLTVVILLFASSCGKSEKLPGAEIKTVSEYKDIFNLMVESSQSLGSMGSGILTDGAVVEDSVEMDSFFGADKDESLSINGTMAPEYSGTNVQVDGVDEGDILKTDGKHIYILRNGYLTIVESDSMTELSTVAIEGREYASVSQIYIYGDKLAAILSVDEWYKNYVQSGEEDRDYSINYGQETVTVIYDISDRNAPKVEKTFSQSGNLVSSRMTDGKLYLITSEQIWTNNILEDKPETYVPAIAVDGAESLIACKDICIFPEIESTVYNIIACVDMESAQQFESVKAALGGYGTVYADTDSLVLALSSYEYEESEGVQDGKNYVKTESRYETAIILYDIKDGVITEKASGTIPGSLLNQFSIDEYNGYYRFVTTDNSWTQTIYTDGLDRYEYDSSESNGLYILNGNLELVGYVDELAKDENVKSVRFDGDVAYFVTFRQVDPLFTVDLSNPENPKIMSELKIPGFSSYLHKFGEGRLLGLGFDADEDTGWTKGLKLSMFDTSDPYNVTEKHKLILEENWSEAIYNHKAILVSVEKNLIAFPAEDGYFVYGYNDESGFFLKNEVEVDDYYYYIGASRGLFIGDNFFVCSSESVMRYSLDDFAYIGRLNLSELPETEY